MAAVATFAVGWLMPRLEGFQREHPFVDPRLATHSNKVYLPAKGWTTPSASAMGAWHGTPAEPLLAAPPLCAPALARRLQSSGRSRSTQATTPRPLRAGAGGEP